MRGSIRLFKVFDISINIHATFFLLILLFLTGGLKWIVVMLGVFFFVTVHELCHSLVARAFGIKVREITLLPIGGVASMTKLPEKPLHEFLISIAGPLSNIAVVLIFFYPVKYIIGEEALFHPLSTATWPLTVAYIYWINIVLAGFNLIPAFPMDGGRMLRAVLAAKLGYQRATRFAATLGHIFAIVFAYFGIVRFNLIMIAIAIFIYMAASSEEVQVDIKETLKKFKVRDILPHDFYTLTADTVLSKALELVFRSHQEDFPVLDGKELAGFVTRQDMMSGVHRFGTDVLIRDIMRKEFPKAKETDSLVMVQNLMQENEMAAMPVMRGDDVIGIVTIEDIGRVYAMISQKG